MADRHEYARRLSQKIISFLRLDVSASSAWQINFNVMFNNQLYSKQSNLFKIGHQEYW